MDSQLRARKEEFVSNKSGCSHAEVLALACCLPLSIFTTEALKGLLLPIPDSQRRWGRGRQAHPLSKSREGV